VTTNPNDSKPFDKTDSGTKPTLPEITTSSDAHPRAAETWIALCAQAAVEQDPKRLLDLVSEINRLLDARKKRLAQEPAGKASE
jgi:hypothetical protein